MPKTIGIARTVSKYVARAAVATPDYEAGIKAPKNPYAASAIAAKDTYRAAITAPEIPDLYVSGIRRAGDAKWSKMALEKGKERYSRGVELGKEYYEGRMTNIIGVIERTTLPKRGPTGSEVNYARSKKMGMSLRAWKLAQKGASPAAS